MYEIEAFDPNARRRHFEAHPDLLVARAPTDSTHASRLSVLAWSEHCVECAIPHCYQTCDLYHARSDGKCRRFTYGIYQNPEVRSWLPYGVEVDFKLISHIWSKGNARTISLSLYRLLDWLQRTAASVVNGLSVLLLPISPKRKLTRGFYHYRKQWVRWLQSRGGRLADGFLLQIINPHQETLRLRLGISPDPRAKGQPNFQESFELPPGFAEHWVPVRRIQERVNLDKPFDISMQLGNVEPRLLYFLCADFVSGLSGPLTQALGQSVQVSAPSSMVPAARVKAVVWDLDHTLWDGVLVESADMLPSLRPGVLEMIRALDQRGILQSVASKNNHDEAWRLLETLGIGEYLLFPQINWGPKSASLKAIAKALNIGQDTLVLIDDQPFERAEVKTNAPGVDALAETVLPTLLLDPRFAGSESSEAKQRRLMYKDETKRTEALSSFEGDYVEFLRDSRITVDLHSPREDERDRLQELIQRTNQMNFSGNRYSRIQLDEVLARPELDGYSVQVTDRFGDYGIVAFCLIRRAAAVVRMVDLAMSCRVQAKHVEHALILTLMARYRRMGSTAFEAEFRRTERNDPAAQVFQDLGFLRAPDEDGREIYRRELQEPVEMLDHIEIRSEEDEVVGQR